MKTKDVDQLVSIVRNLCLELEKPYYVTRFHWLMLGLIELAREGNAYKAMDVAFEANAQLVALAESAQNLVALAEAAKNVNKTQPSYTGHVYLRPEPKHTATVEDMQRAAAAAIAADEEMDEYECDVCHKLTIVPMDSGTPKGWTIAGNPSGEEYKCVECSNFPKGV